MYRTALTIAYLALGCLFLAATSLQAEQSTDEAPKINYADHVLPIFREHCFQCHNANDAKGGLALDTFAALMEGGGSGEIVYQGDADGSRLYQLMTHEDTPVMPPNQDPIAAEKLEIIRQWIGGGLLETSGSKVRKKKGPSLTFASTEIGAKPEAIAMPESVWRVPVVTPERAAAASAVAASPWAPLVAIGGQRQVAMYSTDSGELVGVIPYPEGVPQSIRFSQDGAYLLIAGGTHASKGTAALYEVKTGNRVATVGDELDTVFGADVNETLTRIALGGPQKIVRVLEISSGEVLFELKKHTDWIYCVDYSPDGVLIASGDRSGGLHIWEADTGRLYLDLIGHKGAVRGVSWRADSNVLVSASEDGTVKMWEMTAGKQLKSFNAHGGGATGVVMAKDGRMATCGKDRTVKLWKADGAAIATFPAFAEAALEVAITHDGSKVIGGDWNGKTVMWSTADPKLATELLPNPPSLEQQQANCATRLEAAEQAAAAADAAVVRQQESLKAASQSHDRLLKQMADTQSELARINQEKVAAEQALVDIKTRNADQVKKRISAETLIAQLKKQVDDASAQMQKFASQVSAATERRDAATQQRTAVAADLAAVRLHKEKLKTDAASSLNQITLRQLEIAGKERAAADAQSQAEAKCQDAEARLADLNQMIAAASEAIRPINEQLGAAKLAQRTAMQSLSDLQVTIADTQEKVDEKNTAIAAIQKQIAAAKDDSQKQALGEALVAAERELASANAVKATSEKQLADATTQKEAYDQQIEQLSHQVAELTQKQTELTSSRDAAQQTLTSLTASRDTAAKVTAGFTTEKTTIAGERAAAEQMTEEVVEKIAGVVAREAELTRAHSRLDAQVAADEAARVAADAKLNEFKAAAEAVRIKLTAAQAQQQAAATTIAQLDAKTQTQSAAIAKATADIQQLTTVIPKVEMQIADAKGKVDQLSQSLAAATESAVTARANATRVKQKLEGISTELVAFKSQATKLAQAYQAAEADAIAKRNAIQPAAADAAKLAESVATRDSQLKELAATLAELQARVAEMQTAQQSEQKSLEETKEKLQKLEAAAEDAAAEAEAKKAEEEFFRSVYGA